MRMVTLILGGLICTVWFLIIHFIKLMRMYLVLLDQKIEFKKFIFGYLRTTAVNLIIPFKLGEIYRVAVFSKLSGKVRIGLTSVIADRFFDTFALILILLPLEVLYPNTVSYVSVFLTVFVILVLFVFWMFPSAYRYLNKYIIVNRSSSRSLAVLKGLEVCNMAYEYVKQLVSGRYALMTLLSFMAWVLEGGLLYIIAKIIGYGFSGDMFVTYISSIMSSNSNSLFRFYTYFSICVILTCTLINGIVLIKNKYVVDKKYKKEA